MPDKVLRYSGSFCSIVSFIILVHFSRAFSARFQGRLDQLCDVIVFKKFRFHRPHEKTKTEFSKISTLESVFKKLHFRSPPEMCGRGLKLPNNNINNNNNNNVAGCSGLR